MGIYVRGNKLWLRFQDASGKWRSASSGFHVGDEAKAQDVLDEVERRVAATRGPATAETIVAEAGAGERLAAYARRWLSKRTGSCVGDERGKVELHIIPALGHYRLSELRPKLIRDFVKALMRAPKRRRAPDGSLVATGETLAPRTVYGIYSLLRVMLGEAVAEEVIPTSPCVLKKGDLPARKDKDPAWRRTAVFTRDEVETILSDDRIPEDRRTTYALLFLGAMRFGEAAALTWADYDAACSPLGKIAITKSYNSNHKTVKATKTDNPREMPVHPTLAKVLAAWKLSGWERMVGRAPRPDDLMVVSRRGRPRNVSWGLKRFHEDLERIGLRTRRQHDTRRTFISIARADGARPDILRWATHGPTGDIVDVYTTLPWDAVCAEVAKAKIAIREGAVIAFPKAASGGGGGSLQSPLQSGSTLNSNRKFRGDHDAAHRVKSILGATREGDRIAPERPPSTPECHHVVAERDTPLQDERLLASIVSAIAQAIEVQAGNAYWRARGVVLPAGFAEDAARNAAGVVADLVDGSRSGTT